MFPGTGYQFWSVGLLTSAVQHCTAVFIWAVLGIAVVALLAIPLGRVKQQKLVAVFYGGLWAVVAWQFRDQLFLMADSAVNYQTFELSGDILIDDRAPLATGILEAGAGVARSFVPPIVFFGLVSILSGVATALIMWRAVVREGSRGIGPAPALALLFCMPMSFIFFGHVETYPILMVTFTLALAALKWDLDRDKIGPLSILLLLGLCFMHYMSMLLLLPVLSWFIARRLNGGWLKTYAVLGVVGLAALLLVPPLREYTLAARNWTGPEIADYLWDVLNGWLLLFVPLGIVGMRYRKIVFRDDFGKFLGLVILTYALFPLLAMFDLGVYRDLDLLSPAYIGLVFLVVLAVARGGAEREMIPAMMIGVILLAALQVHQICPAGATLFEKHLDRKAMEPGARWIGTEVLAFHYFGRGELDEAERVMRKAIADRPANERLYGPLGEMQIAKGDTTAAITSLTRSMSSWRAPRSASLLAELLTRTGKAEMAIEILRPFRNLVLGDSRAAAALAVAYYRAGHPDSMIAATRERLAVDPLDHLAHFNAASGWARLGNLDAAIEELNQAVRLDPENPTYRRQLERLIESSR